MARGYPDYFGQSIFTKYGQFYFDIDSKAGIADGVTYEFVEILGKGRVYNHLFFFTSVASGASVLLGLDIDGVTTAQLYINDFMDMGLWDGSSFKWCCTQYDDIAKCYTVVLREGITFDYQFRAWCKNETGANVDGLSVLCYSAIGD